LLSRHVLQLDISRGLVGTAAEQARVEALLVLSGDGKGGWQKPAALGFNTKSIWSSIRLSRRLGTLSGEP
jgi:hypothetical protein